MKPAISPVFIALVFLFCIAITRRARSIRSIEAAEARSVYALLLALFAWALVAIVLGIRGRTSSSWRAYPCCGSRSSLSWR